MTSKKIEIDFETFSQADLKKVGAWMYSVHPSTEILCMSYMFPNEGTNLWIPCPLGEHDLDQRLVDAINDPSYVFEAHNAGFEEVIWLNVASRYGWPIIEAKRWNCSAAKVASHALPRALDASAKVLELPVEKDATGHRLMLKHSKPRKPTKHNKSTRHHNFQELQKIFSYCRKDTVVERAVSEELPDLSKAETAIYHFTQKVNLRGVLCDIKTVKKIISFMSTFENSLNQELTILTDGKITTSNQRQRFIDYAAEHGYELMGLAKDVVEETLKDEALPDEVRKILNVRVKLGKASIKKYQKMQHMASPEDNRIRNTLVYHQASTGRWAGSGIQPQNFPRGSLKDVDSCLAWLQESDTLEEFESIYDDVGNAFSSLLRSMLMAPEGKKFYCGDYSAIEARVVFWLAGQEDGLDIFRGHGRIYEEMASTIFGIREDLVTKDQRFLGKQAILGCSYQMGVDKFMGTCEQLGHPIERSLAQTAVSTYRERWDKVKSLWHETQETAKQAIRTGQAVECRKVIWKVVGQFLYCKLPSGRRLAYYRPNIGVEKTKWGVREQITFTGVNSQTGRGERQKTYGGKLVENITQAVARDLLCYSSLNLEKFNYPIVMSVHDELVSETLLDYGSLGEFLDIMGQTPAWAEGCPVKVEGWEGLRYKKD